MAENGRKSILASFRVCAAPETRSWPNYTTPVDTCKNKLLIYQSGPTYLKQTDWESLIDFCGQPDPEVCVDLVRVDDGLHQLVAERQ